MRIRGLFVGFLLAATVFLEEASRVSAEGQGPSVCRAFAIGQFFSFVAQEEGYSAERNPGNAQNEAPPFVPFIVGCNPNAEQAP